MSFRFFAALEDVTEKKCFSDNGRKFKNAGGGIKFFLGEEKALRKSAYFVCFRFEYALEIALVREKFFGFNLARW